MRRKTDEEATNVARASERTPPKVRVRGQWAAAAADQGEQALVVPMQETVKQQGQWALVAVTQELAEELAKDPRSRKRTPLSRKTPETGSTNGGVKTPPVGPPNGGVKRRLLGPRTVGSNGPRFQDRVSWCWKPSRRRSKPASSTGARARLLRMGAIAASPTVRP